MAKESGSLGKVLYHATNFTWTKPEFHGLGFHAGTLKAAQDRMKSFTSKINPHIKIVEITLKNPLHIGRDYRFHDSLTKVSNELYKDGVISKEERNAFIRVYDDAASFDNLKKLLLEKYGYDGVIYRNNIEDRGSDSYIAFFPEQIKILGEYSAEKMKDGGSIGKLFLQLIKDSKEYKTAIDPELLNKKKGHALDNLPKGTQFLMVDVSLFEKETCVFGKVSDGKIAYHERPVKDLEYWVKQINKGKRPPVLLTYDEQNNQLRVRDGNHRLNVYLTTEIKEIPVVLTKDAQNYLQQLKYKDGGSTLLAPNGKPSNLTSEQYALVRTPEFKKWFGDWEKSPKTASKVVDGNGEPLVCYHGTQTDFNVFDKEKINLNYRQSIAFHFSDTDDRAKIYAKQQGFVKSVFLNIKNPLVARSEFGAAQEAEEYIDTHKRILIEKISENNSVNDGIIATGYNYTKSIIVFQPEQIKLADGTNTTFNPENADIRFKDGGSNLLAPNGKPSKLTSEQYALVRTPEFKKWFGDWENEPEKASRVVDENGEPMVVWHGTKKDFNVFDINKFNENESSGDYVGEGFYFTGDKSKAKQYGFNTKSVFLKSKNPIVVSEYKDFKKVIEDAFGFRNVGNVKIPHYYTLKKENPSKIRNKFIEFGYDGLVDNLYNQYAVFEPEQIKLADGTNKTFNPENLDIRFKEGGVLDIDKFREIIHSDEFIKWFDGSKVTDSNNLPLVVYHRAKGKSKYDRKFNIFENKKGKRNYMGRRVWVKSPSFFFSDDDEKIKHFGRVSIPCFLNIKKPLNYNGWFDMEHAKELELLAKNIALRYIVKYEWQLKDVPRWVFYDYKEYTDKIQELGYDGVFDTEKEWSEERNTYIVFNPNQIKLADGTNTTFNPENPDIRFNDGGSTLLAPNGNPSNLTSEQYALVRTPEFKQWFGDWEKSPKTASKIVDENGEPMIVHHGSRSKKRFTEFKTSKLGSGLTFPSSHIGFFFSPKRWAAETYGEKIYSVFLRIVNPSTLSYDENVRIDSKQKAISKKNEIEKNNCDGVIVGEKQEYVVFYPEQIKLADGTNKTFNSENPDIRFNDGGSTLLAPNGKPSNLTSEQYALVRTPEFKSWFGDWEKSPKTASKVVDKNGEPLMVYHGTVKEFTVFSLKHATKQTGVDWGKMGFFFTDNKSLAEDFTRHSWGLAEKSKFKDGSRVVSCFLSIKNPYVVNAHNWTMTSESPDVLRKELIIDNYDGYFIEPLSQEDKDKWISLFGQRGIKELINYQYIAFESTQIKLATGENKTFDMNNPDIRFKEGGEADKYIVPVGSIIQRSNRGNNEFFEIVEFLGYYKKPNLANETLFPKYAAYPLKSNMTPASGGRLELFLPSVKEDFKYKDRYTFNYTIYFENTKGDARKFINQEKIDTEKRRTSESEVKVEWQGVKPTYLMNKEEYKQVVTPILKEYNKFLAKNKQYFIKAGYDGVLYFTYEQFDEAEKKQQYYREEYTKEQWVRKNKVEPVKNVPQNVINEYNSYITKLSELFGEENLKLVQDDENTNNKRSVRRAIDDGTYVKLLKQGKINYSFLKSVFDSVGLNIPPKLEKVEKEVVETKFDETAETTYVQGMEKYKAQIKEHFKEEVIYYYEKYKNRYLGLIKKYLAFTAQLDFDKIKEHGIESVTLLKIELSNYLNLPYEKKEQRFSRGFYDYFFNEKVDSLIISISHYVGRDKKIIANWEAKLETDAKSYSNFLFDDFSEHILSKLETINKVNIVVPNLKDGEIITLDEKGFNSILGLVYPNGYKLDIETQTIFAGGYNIQKLHLRYLTKIRHNNKVLSQEELQESYKNFKAEDKKNISLEQGLDYIDNLNDNKFNDGGSTLLAPNGNPSKLSLEQYAIVRTPEFKNWFGDWENDPHNSSKVVDENGEPRVCFHSSPYDFTEFKITKNSIGIGQVGFWFDTDKQFSSIFKNDDGKTYEVFLNIRNEWHLQGDEGFDEFINYAVSRTNPENKNIANITKEQIDKLRWHLEQSKDGIYINETTADSGISGIKKGEKHSIYIAFYSNQIKLADGSNKTFDANNPDIRFKDGGKAGRLIYHFTESIDSLDEILKGDSLMSGVNVNYGLGYENISFTWNPDLWDVIYFGDRDYRWKVKIEFDYDKISKKWKFEPYDYFKEKFGEYDENEKEEIVATDEMNGVVEFINKIYLSSEYRGDINYYKEKYPTIKFVTVKRRKFSDADSDIRFDDGGITDIYTGGKIKKAYVSIKYETNRKSEPFSMDWNIISSNDKVLADLVDRKLDGVMGVSSSKYNVSDWFIHRDILLVMPFDKFKEINNVSQVQYFDADYLTKDNLKIFYRLYQNRNIDKFSKSQVIGNILKKLFNEVRLAQKTVNDRSLLNDLYKVERIFDVYYSGKFDRWLVEDETPINSPKEFAEVVIKYLNSDEFEKDYYTERKGGTPLVITSDILAPVIARGLVEAAKVYRDESELILTDNILNIPEGTKLFFRYSTDSDKEYFQKKVEEFKLKEKYGVYFIHSTYLTKLSGIHNTAKDKKWVEEREDKIKTLDEQKNVFLNNMIDDIVKQWKAATAAEIDKRYDEYYPDGYSIRTYELDDKKYNSFEIYEHKNGTFENTYHDIYFPKDKELSDEMILSQLSGRVKTDLNINNVIVERVSGTEIIIKEIESGEPAYEIKYYGETEEPHLYNPISEIAPYVELFNDAEQKIRDVFKYKVSGNHISKISKYSFWDFVRNVTYYFRELQEKKENDTVKGYYDSQGGEIYYESVLYEMMAYFKDNIELEQKLVQDYKTKFAGDIFRYYSEKEVELKHGGVLEAETATLLAPNGEVSNLTPKQHALVRTPEFISWFGDWINSPKTSSKVLDENGEPRVVYYGSNETFHKFDRSFIGKRSGLNDRFFTLTSNIDMAKFYGLNVKPYFLNIRTMPEYNNKSRYYDKLRVNAGYKLITIHQLQEFHEQGFEGMCGMDSPAVEFKQTDGFVVKDTIEISVFSEDYEKDYRYVGDTYYVYNPEQIKLADGTNKTFNPSNPDTRFKKGGNVNNK